ALLAVDPDLREAHPLVERDARLVRGKAREHELVEAKLPPELDEPGQHDPSHALAPPVPFHVDGDVGQIVVALARVEGIEARPRPPPPRRLPDHHRVARAARGEPATALVQVTKLRLEGGDPGPRCPGCRWCR